MLFRLRRWYNKNSKTIWKVTGIIVFLLLLLRTANYFASKDSGIKQNSNSDINKPIRNEYTDLSIESDKSVLSNEKITNGRSDAIETVNQFFSHCNEQKIKEAYGLITKECKEKMYPSLKAFQESYYKKVFSGEKKDISLEVWAGNIYKVKISDDILSSGVYNEDNIRQDYITTKKIDDGYKLNINSYIDTENIEKTGKFGSIEIIANKKDIYMDYEVYYFTVKNNMDNPILLDNLEELNSIYVKDKNNINYSAYTHDISVGELLMSPRETRTIKIKFYNNFITTKKIKNIVFSKIIVDYNQYSYLKDKSRFNNFNQISINIQG